LFAILDRKKEKIPASPWKANYPWQSVKESSSSSSREEEEEEEEEEAVEIRSKDLLSSMST
jgi:hypothetical protein